MVLGFGAVLRVICPNLMFLTLVLIPSRIFPEHIRCCSGLSGSFVLTMIFLVNAPVSFPQRIVIASSSS